MARTEAEEAARGFTNHVESKFRGGMPADRDFWRGGVRDDYDFAAFLSDAAGIHRTGSGASGCAARSGRYFRNAAGGVPAFKIRRAETNRGGIWRRGGSEFMAGTHDAGRGAVVYVLGCGGERIFYRFRV